mgnify:CR=1 FL=1
MFRIGGSMSFTEEHFNELPLDVQKVIGQAKQIGGKCDTWRYRERVLACVYGMSGELAKTLYTQMVNQGWHPVRPNGALVWGSFEQ